MDIKQTKGYAKLLAAVEHDEKTSPGFHDYRKKLDWILARAAHYAEKTGLSASEILDSWEEQRDYWYMNYYQEAKQPEIKGDKYRVFETPDELRASIGEMKFRCPSCNGVSTNPYECNAGKCDWKSYGLFGTMGLGVFAFVKSERMGQEFFMPLSWEPAAQ